MVLWFVPEETVYGIIPHFRGGSWAETAKEGAALLVVVEPILHISYRDPVLDLPRSI